MQIMYCYFNMFDLTSSVMVIPEDTQKAEAIFTGTFEEVCEFMATEYQMNSYQKIILAGPYAYAVKDRIYTYSHTNFNEGKQLNIEIVEE